MWGRTTFRLLAESAAGVPLHLPRALARVGEALRTDSAHNGASVRGASSCPDGRSDSGTRRVPLQTRPRAHPAVEGELPLLHTSVLSVSCRLGPRGGATAATCRPTTHPGRGHTQAAGTGRSPCRPRVFAHVATPLPSETPQSRPWEYPIARDRSAVGVVRDTHPTLGEPLTGLSLLHGDRPAPESRLRAVAS